MEYSCGRSKHLLDTDNLGSDYHTAYIVIGAFAGLLRHMYWIFQFIQSLPEWLAVLISPNLGLTLQLRKVWSILAFLILLFFKIEATKF